jgi:hypothetical protein
MRDATGGLAAIENSTPAAISTSTQPSSSRSTVNHQSATSPLSDRDISMALRYLLVALDTVQLLYKRAEIIAAHLEVRILVKRRTGR